MDSLLREMDTQREVLRERNRLLAEAGAAPAHRGVGSPSLRAAASPAGRRLVMTVSRAGGRRLLKARTDQRARTRRERTERFVEHHRGQ